MADTSLPPYAVVTTHPVADFDAWKAGFDDHEPVRREAGFLGHHLNRHRDDPNRVSIYLALSDLEKAQAFTASPDLAEIMAEVGVTGPPEFAWMVPVREAVVWDRELPAFLLSHSVSDFGGWLPAYDEADELRTSNGIIGHAANRRVDDPNVAVVYHQAESFDALESFLASPDLRQAMEQAGVTSAPDVAFMTGGWAKMYD
ncbi:MAG: antibiotic biosynthesis monooxygenase [Acidimicrobiia bacterium]|nr:antibiotic biosynthesis monooxygenase [Acidimicrobiia bacterium]